MVGECLLHLLMGDTTYYTRFLCCTEWHHDVFGLASFFVLEVNRQLLDHLMGNSMIGDKWILAFLTCGGLTEGALLYCISRGVTSADEDGSEAQAHGQ